MPQVSSPNLLDHAIGAVFEDFGRHRVFVVRRMLELFREREAPVTPVQPLIDHWMPGATLKPRYAALDVEALWGVLDEKTQEEVGCLQRRFALPS